MKSQMTVIYAHPYDKSFNHAILETVLSNLKHSGTDYNLIDLYKDGFNPVYSTEELALFKTGKTLDPMVAKYQEILKTTDKLMIITPIWWNSIPAILKGFFDKVLKMNFAYISVKTGVKGLLTNVQSAEIITTSTSPKFYIRYFAGNCINGSVKSTLKQIGIKQVTWKHLGNIGNSTDENRKKFLKSL